jgi:hypothetical protein
MRPVAVVVLDILVDDGLEMSTTEDEHPVQTFTPDSTDEALSDGVCTGRPDRSADGPDTLEAEDLVEAGRELGVTIADQEFDRPGSLGQVIGQIPGLLITQAPVGFAVTPIRKTFRVSSSMKSRT